MRNHKRIQCLFYFKVKKQANLSKCHNKFGIRQQECFGHQKKPPKWNKPLLKLRICIARAKKYSTCPGDKCYFPC